MQSIDESIIRDLQARYYNEEPRALTMLFCETRHIAAVVLNSILMTRRILIEKDRMDQVIHDASSRFVAQYLKHPGYWVDHFTARIKSDVNFILFDGGHQERPKKVAERNTIPLDGMQIPCEKREEREDRKDYARDLSSEHQRGPDVLLSILRARNYTEAVLAVANITGKAWCYDRAVKLKEVYRMTRRRDNGR